MKKKGLLKAIFSVENEGIYKVTTLLGFNFKVKNKYKILVDRLNAQEIELKKYSEQFKLLSKYAEDLIKLEQANSSAFDVIFKKCDKLSVELASVKSYITEKPVQNIRKYLYEFAGMETARYIIENMPAVPYFKNKYDLLSYALSKVTLDGLYLEFGVYSGNTINHIAEARPDVAVYGFDSFEGLPESWRSGFEKGKFAKDILPEVRENVQLIKGWFDDSLPEFVKDHNGQCAFLHVDCDLYSSTKTIFENLKDSIKPGTIIVFDEYFNYPNWQNHEYKAFQEFITDSGLKYEYLGYVYTLEQVAVKIL